MVYRRPLKCRLQRRGKWARRPDTAGRTALIWESEDGKQNRSPILLYTNKSPVRRQALKARHLKGDVIAIYMPMIPETVIAMLAAAKSERYSHRFFRLRRPCSSGETYRCRSEILVTADAFCEGERRSA
ncbi:hypothetical protein PO124_18540 [Bacillus licheniformis]|nr:hypothetical protein [Bacillus licheniformis]